MLTVRRQLRPSAALVAAGAHSFGVIFAADMWTSCNLIFLLVLFVVLIKHLVFEHKLPLQKRAIIEDLRHFNDLHWGVDVLFEVKF